MEKAKTLTPPNNAWRIGKLNKIAVKNSVKYVLIYSLERL